MPGIKEKGWAKEEAAWRHLLVVAGRE